MELASGVISSMASWEFPERNGDFLSWDDLYECWISQHAIVIDYQRVQKIIVIIDLRRIWYMTSGDLLGFTQTTWDFNPEKWMGSFTNLVNIHFPMTPTCGLPGLSPLKLSSWIMGFRPGRRWVRLPITSPLFSFGVGRRVNPQGFFFVGGCRCDI